MKIAILGAGAMGSLYGGPLSQNNDVWFIDVWKEHVDKINKEGLKIKFEENIVVYNPKAASSSQGIGKADLVIIFVKSTNTEEALKNNNELFGEDTIVLTLQNGYGNDNDILPYVKKENLVIGTSACGATVLGPGYVLQAGIGVTTIGVLDGVSLKKAKILANVLDSAGFECLVTENIMETVWSKLLVNIGLNGVLAMLDMRNGFMAESRAAYDIALELLKEAALVASAEGYDFDYNQIAKKYYIDGAKVVGKNICSMLQDVRKKRKTEVERINGVVVDLGKKHGISTPYNELIVKFINAKEDSYNFA